MPKFVKKPLVIEAEQFFYDKPAMAGVFYPPIRDGVFVGDAFVVTAHNQRVYLQVGDWIVPEPDGEHYYPIRADIFKESYIPVAE